jgi:hypothetical protein
MLCKLININAFFVWVFDETVEHDSGAASKPENE